MHTVRVRSHFSSAHFLRGYKGKCEDMHGHNWQVEVVAGSEKLDEQGMVVDFKDLKGFLKEVMAALDHKNLNELGPFMELNPTSENIAKYVFDKMAEVMVRARITEVTVWETETSSATYSPR